jgi:hypothetical protein
MRARQLKNVIVPDEIPTLIEVDTYLHIPADNKI